MPQCPKCKSKRVVLKPWLGLIYQCKDCNWRGPLVIQKKKGQKV